MKNVASNDRPRRPLIQFSLRLLFIAFTGFAIGFPVWYRWPYEEITTEKVGDHFVSISPIDPFGERSSSNVISTTTWQRQWGGGRLKHGAEQVDLGDFRRSTIYDRGRKHGPYLERSSAGDVEIKGQFVDDMKEGVWTYKDHASERIATWHRDRLHGPYEIELPEKKLRFTFANGKLTHYDGQPARNRLFDLLEAGQIDARTATELRQRTVIDFVTPLRDGLTYLRDAYNNIHICVDRNHVKDVNATTSAQVSGVDLCTALTVLTAPINLGCDYRYGCVWITSPEDAENWHDSTGVADITPALGADLARAWNEPVVINAFNQPLTAVFERIAQPLAIEIDTSRLASSPESYLVTRSISGLPFRHVLGILLYDARCRCQLEDGKLVILPPKETASQ